MLRSKGSLFARLRRAIVRHRGLAFALVAWEAFFFVDGLSVVEAREQHRLEVKRDRAYMAESFGIPAELWTADPESTWQSLGRELAGDAWQTAVTTAQSLQTKLGPSATVSVATTAAVTAIVQDSSDESVAAPTPEKPRLRRAAPIFEDGTQRFATAAGASKLADKKGLPIQQVQRKAKRMDAKTAPPTSSRKIQPSPKAKRVRKSFAPDIAALAAELRSPAKIFRYIHDTVDFDPKWGADSPPSGTLWEGRGTSWDQAWLLQELLLAAGIDARLEWGTVRLTPELLLEITGVDDPFQAGDLLTTAGNDVVLVMNGTKVVSAHMPHVWVKAHVDYIPFRGSEPGGTGDTWVRMDPSFKTFDRDDGIALDPSVDFVLADHLQGASEDSPRAKHEAALLAAGQSQGASSLDDLKAQRAIHAENFPFVPGTLRTKIISLGGEAEIVPSTMKARTELSISDPDGNVMATWPSNLPALYGKRLEIQWPGATSADEATLDLYGGDIFSTPPYELEVRPSILVNGTELATGTAVGAAEDVELTVTVTPPSGPPSTSRWDMFAGEHAVLAFDWGAVPSQVVASHSGTEPAAKLAAAGTTYLQSLAADLDHLATLHHRRAVNLGTTVLAVQRGAVATGPEGTPQSFGRGPLSLETGARTLGIFTVDGSQKSTVPILELLGSQGSIRESEALASVFGGEHLNAVDFLKEAVRQGQTLTLVEQGNLDAALFDAALSPEAEGSVRFAVEQGAVAWIPESQLDINGWTTTGYIVEDPRTGAGGYFVTYERIVTPLDGLVTFHSISDLQEITAPTSVVASIDAEGIDNWTLSTRPAGASTTTVIATGTGPVTNLEVGQFDPTLLLNGLHDIVLTGRDGTGRTIVGKITVFVDGQMKIGHFTLSFIDLQIPLSGLDLQVVRTYDSRRRFEQGDFGQGWILDIRQGSYRNNRTPGDGWQIPATSGPWGLPCSQVTETKSHLTTVRLSDQEVYRFRLNLSNPATIIGGCIADAAFEWVDGPLPGTKLEILGNREVLYRNDSDGVLDRNTLEPYVPQDVKLTTRDGRIFHLDLLDGVTHIEDLHGNALDITPDGISHTSGRRIDFVRDGEGRIVEIVDPMDQRLRYEYDSAGDLVAGLDLAGHSTRFSYEDHFLSEIVDPAGVRAIRNDYDEEGRLIRTTDAAGHSIEINHDLAGRRQVVTDRSGNIHVLTYDSRGNVLEHQDSLGLRLRRTFDADDRVLTQSDAAGHTWTYAYSAAGDLLSRTDPIGATRRFTFDARGRVLTETDPLQRETRFQYDGLGNLLRETDPTGAETVRTYNSAGLLLTVTDAEGATTSYEYDRFGRTISRRDPLGALVLMEYDDAGSLLSESLVRVLPDGTEQRLTTTSTYDAQGRVLTVTLPDGETSSRTYDAVGNLKTETAADGRTTTYSYDPLGRLSLISYADGTSEEKGYDAEGRLTRTKNRSGKTARLEYDVRGRTTRMISAAGAVRSYKYGAGDRPEEVTDPRGFKTRYVYDVVGRLVRAVDPLGHGVESTWDEAGRLTLSRDARGFETRYKYDAADRLVGLTHPDGSVESYAYDGVGRLLSRTDPLGNKITYIYDLRGDLVQWVDAENGSARFEYGAFGQLEQVVDPENHSTRFEYDDRFRLIKTILADGSTETRTYGPSGRLKTLTDFGGRQMSWIYDASGRVAEQRFEDGTSIAYTYTGTGRRLSVVDERGTTIYGWDDDDRLISVQDPSGSLLTYTYDPAGNRLSVTVDTGAGIDSFATFFEWDAANRLSTIVDTENRRYARTYDADGNPTLLTYPNGTRTETVYDGMSRPIEIVTTGPEGMFQTLSYSYDLAGRRTAVLEEGGTRRTFAYDKASRLSEEAVTDGAGALLFSRSYGYDRAGNRLTETRVGESPASLVYTYDQRHRLLSAGDTAYTWDAAGNMTAAGDTQLEWDVRNRLRSVSTMDGAEHRYTYDLDGAMMSRLDDDGSTTTGTRFLIDPAGDGDLSQVVGERNDAGTITARYTRGAGLLARHAPEGDRYYHRDALGSVRLVTDESGNVVAGYDYTAFGSPMQSGPDRFLFTGEARDSETGFYHLRARWIDPTTGRFLSRDPFSSILERPETLHRYTYVANDPVNHTDPTGLFFDMLGGFVSGLSLAALSASSPIQKAKAASPITILGILRKGKLSAQNSWDATDVSQRLQSTVTFLKKFGLILSSRTAEAEYPSVMSRPMAEFNMKKAFLNLEPFGAMASASRTVPVLFIDRFTMSNEVLCGLALRSQRHLSYPVWGATVSSRCPIAPGKNAPPRIIAHELVHTLGDMGHFGGPENLMVEGKKGIPGSQLTSHQQERLLKNAALVR